MKNIISMIFKKNKEAESIYKCWICEAEIKEHIDFLYHIHECNAVKKSGLPLHYVTEAMAWRFDRRALLDKNLTNAQ